VNREGDEAQPGAAASRRLAAGRSSRCRGGVRSVAIIWDSSAPLFGSYTRGAMTARNVRFSRSSTRLAVLGIWCSQFACVPPRMMSRLACVSSTLAFNSLRADSATRALARVRPSGWFGTFWPCKCKQICQCDVLPPERNKINTVGLAEILGE